MRSITLTVNYSNGCHNLDQVTLYNAKGFIEHFCEFELYKAVPYTVAQAFLASSPHATSCLSITA
jgi:hypothetical protein